MLKFFDKDGERREAFRPDGRDDSIFDYLETS